MSVFFIYLGAEVDEVLVGNPNFVVISNIPKDAVLEVNDQHQKEDQPENLEVSLQGLRNIKIFNDVVKDSDPL
jgi:hypothetical protein